MKIATSIYLTVVVVILSPFWVPQTRSAMKWTVTEKPAKCFGRDYVTMFGLAFGACSDWKHCDTDDDKNIAKGYSCPKKLSANSHIEEAKK